MGEGAGRGRGRGEGRGVAVGEVRRVLQLSLQAAGEPERWVFPRFRFQGLHT